MAFKFCPECGFKFDREYKFCPECGYKLAGEEKKPEPLFDFSEDTAKYADDKFGGFDEQLKKQEEISAAEEEELKLAIKHYDATDLDNYEELKKDFPIFKKFAEKGNAEAQFYLGACYGNGTVPEDDDKWLFWMQKSAEQGYNKAQLQMGEYYEGEQDYQKAAYWYGKAADSDDKITKKWAKYNLELLKKKQQQPKVKAKKTPEEEELDWALRNCESTCKEYKKAFDIIKKYAENGNAEAQYTLGLCYANGDVVPEDFKKAYYWHKKAADQGHKNAQWEIEHWDFE